MHAADLTAEDNGNYTCEIRGSESSVLASQTFLITVQGIVCNEKPTACLTARIVMLDVGCISSLIHCTGEIKALCTQDLQCLAPCSDNTTMLSIKRSP